MRSEPFGVARAACFEQLAGHCQLRCPALRKDLSQSEDKERYIPDTSELVQNRRIQLWMVLPWIWVVLWICNVGDLALTWRWPALTCAGFSRAWGQIFLPTRTDGIQKPRNERKSVAWVHFSALFCTHANKRVGRIPHKRTYTNTQRKPLNHKDLHVYLAAIWPRDKTSFNWLSSSYLSHSKADNTKPTVIWLQPIRQNHRWPCSEEHKGIRFPPPET